jgi:hypothetical protein
MSKLLRPAAGVLRVVVPAFAVAGRLEKELQQLLAARKKS